MDLDELSKVFFQASLGETPFPTWRKLSEALDAIQKDKKLHKEVERSFEKYKPLSWGNLQNAVEEELFSVTVAHCKHVSICVEEAVLQRAISPAQGRGRIVRF